MRRRSSRCRRNRRHTPTAAVKSFKATRTTLSHSKQAVAAPAKKVKISCNELLDIKINSVFSRHEMMLRPITDFQVKLKVICRAALATTAAELRAQPRAHPGGTK